MKHIFRLTRSTDFKHVREAGRSYANPLVLLAVLPNGEKTTRVGITAGRAMGKAVERNRAKRRLRACVTVLQENISPGWDLVLIARKPMRRAGFQSLSLAVEDVFIRSGVMAAVGNVANG